VYLDRIISFSASVKSPIIEKSLYLRATQLKEASDFSRSKELYAKLLGAYPQSSYRDWAWYHLAEVSPGEGRDEEARKYLDAVIQRSADAPLKSLATNDLSGISLGPDVDEYDRLINQFGRE
jgi:TolA-binding protein